MATTFGKAIRVLFVSLIYVFIYQLMQVVTEAVSGLLGIYRALPVSRYNIQYVFSDSVMSRLFVCMTLAMFIAIAIYWAFGLLRERRLESELCFGRLSESGAIAAVLLAIGCRLGVSAYTAVAENISVLKDSMDSGIKLEAALNSPVNIILALLSMMILGPIFEEILFRGLVQTELMRGFPPSVAIAVCALIFAAAHGILFQSIFTFFVGLALGWCYYVTKNLFASMIVHMIFNVSAMLTVQYDLSGPICITLLSFGSVIMVTLGCLLIYQNRYRTPQY